LILCLAHPAKSEDLDYGIVVDAGSSGSRVHVFRWPRQSPETELMSIETVHQQKFKPSLDELEDDEAGLKKNVQSMVEAAKTKVPAESQCRTSIYFFATAGMRLVKEDKANKLFALVDDWLSGKSFSPFRYDQGFGARILSGEEEGAFMWITVNSLLGIFDPGNTKSSIGILELGGASTQIAFEPVGQQILDDKFNLRVMGHRYSLYVHSYLDYGQDYVFMWTNNHLAFAELPNPTDNPCMVVGDTVKAEDGSTITGTGNPEACKKILDELVYKVSPDRCYPKPCAIGTTYEPTIDREEKFYVLGAFYYALKTVGAIGKDGVFNLNDALHKVMAYCKRTYDDIVREIPSQKDYASKTCTSGLYMVELFHRGYGFALDTDQLSTIDNINGQELSWTMGALLYETKFQFKRRR
jgi:apyrase